MSINKIVYVNIDDNCQTISNLPMLSHWHSQSTLRRNSGGKNQDGGSCWHPRDHWETQRLWGEARWHKVERSNSKEACHCQLVPVLSLRLRFRPPLARPCTLVELPPLQLRMLAHPVGKESVTCLQYGKHGGHAWWARRATWAKE